MTFIREYKDPNDEVKKNTPNKNIWAIDDDFDEGFLVAYDQKHQDNVICCCQKNLPHDESMKFTIRGDPQNL